MSTTTTPTTPTTLLDAVNALLQAIRVAEVSSLALVDANTDSAGAKKAIDQASREVQLEGWNFNREREAVYDIDPSGYINLPANTLKVHTARYSSGNRLVQRGLRLYDPKKRTFVFTESATVDIVLGLEFAELPFAARALITGTAARRFCLPRLPESSTFEYTKEYLMWARGELEREDLDTEDTDLKMTSPHFTAMGRR